MTAPSSLRSPVAQLYQPAVDVSPFLRGFILRDTRGCALQGDQLLNRFPASAHCVLSGCQTHPVVSRNRGDTHAFMAMFYPIALPSAYLATFR